MRSRARRTTGRSGSARATANVADADPIETQARLDTIDETTRRPERTALRGDLGADLVAAGTIADVCVEPGEELPSGPEPVAVGMGPGGAGVVVLTVQVAAVAR